MIISVLLQYDNNFNCLDLLLDIVTNKNHYYILTKTGQIYKLSDCGKNAEFFLKKSSFSRPGRKMRISSSTLVVRDPKLQGLTICELTKPSGDLGRKLQFKLSETFLYSPKTFITDFQLTSLSQGEANHIILSTSDGFILLTSFDFETGAVKLVSNLYLKLILYRKEIPFWVAVHRNMIWVSTISPVPNNEESQSRFIILEITGEEEIQQRRVFDFEDEGFKLYSPFKAFSLSSCQNAVPNLKRVQNHPERRENDKRETVETEKEAAVVPKNGCYRLMVVSEELSRGQNLSGSANEVEEDSLMRSPLNLHGFVFEYNSGDNFVKELKALRKVANGDCYMGMSQHFHLAEEYQNGDLRPVVDRNQQTESRSVSNDEDRSGIVLIGRDDSELTVLNFK